jgi:chromate reductase
MLVFLDMPVMQQPEAYVGNAATLFGQDGSIENESTRTFFTTFAQRFAEWIDRIAASAGLQR